MRSLALLLILGGLAVAQPAPDARALFADGKKAFRLGDYDEAIRAWREGYRLKGDPNFLYNIGQAYREKGDLDEAVRFLRSYLKEAPEASNRSAVEERISEMEALIAARQAEKARPPTGPVEPTVVAPPPPIGPLAPAPRRGQGMQIAGLSIAGGGVLLVATGVLFQLRASAAAGDIADAREAGRTWDAELASTDDRGRRSARLSPLFLGLGAGTVVAGGVLFVLGRRRDSSERTALVPSVGNGALGVVVRGSF